MKLKYEKLEKYIEQSDLRNKDLDKKLGKEDVRGISTTKVLIPTNANLNGVKLDNYRVMLKGEFAYVPDTSRRGDKIALALNDESPCLISSIYTVFKIKDQEQLLPEFLYLWFSRSEFDRYARYHSIGSAREVFGWEDMCEVEIPIPSVNVQRKISELYNSLKANLEYLKNSLEKIKKIPISYIDEIKKTKPYVKIGHYIEQSDIRNRDLDKKLDKKDVKGISTAKVLIPTNANLNGVNLDNYRVMLKGEFAYVPDTSRRGDKIALALNKESPCLISSIYTVFKVKDQEKMLPEFLYLWFNRSEFDRYARYHSIGSAREVFNWEDMCNVEVPLPSIEEQLSIIKIHNVLIQRIELIERIEKQIKNLAPILVRGGIEEISKISI